jgi:hypothetical protein
VSGVEDCAYKYKCGVHYSCRDTERQKGVEIFRTFLKAEVNPKRSRYNMGLTPMSHISGFVDGLMKVYYTNIQNHMNRNLMAAFGRYFVTYLRKELNISKKVAAKGKVNFYTIYTEFYKYSATNEEEPEDEDERIHPLFSDDHLTTQQQLDVLDETLDDEEDNEEVLNP